MHPAMSTESLGLVTGLVWVWYPPIRWKRPVLSYEMRSLDIQVYQLFENLPAKVSQYAGSG